MVTRRQRVFAAFWRHAGIAGWFFVVLAIVLAMVGQWQNTQRVEEESQFRAATLCQSQNELLLVMTKVLEESERLREKEGRPPGLLDSPHGEEVRRLLEPRECPPAPDQEAENDRDREGDDGT